jgi:hypothetical protein
MLALSLNDNAFRTAPAGNISSQHNTLPTIGITIGFVATGHKNATAAHSATTTNIDSRIVPRLSLGRVSLLKKLSLETSLLKSIFKSMAASREPDPAPLSHER